MAIEGVMSITSTQVAQPFTVEAIGFPPGSVFITVETQNIRYWFGGREPTPTEGHIMYTGAPYGFTFRQDVENLKMIAASGTAKISYTIKGR